MTTRRRMLGIAGLTAAAPLLGVGAAQAASRISGEASMPITTSGAWCWFGDPRALHYEGEHNRTYVGYLTNKGVDANGHGIGDIQILQYDHDTGEQSAQVLMPDFPRDDHNNPSICVRPDRRVVVFWTAHADRNHPIYYRRSAVPEDINGGWEPVKTLTENVPGNSGWTYPNLHQLSAEPSKLYVFWRGGDANPTFSTTTGADVWTPAQSLISVPGQRPYLKVHSDGVDTIHFAFTQAHPRDVHTSIFYMYYRGGNLYKADGTLIGPIGTAVPPEQADKVYDADAGQPKAWVWDVTADNQGRPVIVYANFPTDADHRYRYARWNGSRWIDNEVTAAGGSISEDTREPNYSGGIVLDHSNPNVVLLSRPGANGYHEVERWSTDDNGQSWSSEPITQNSSELNVRPFKPIGLRGNGAMSVLWMAGAYPSYTTYETRIMAIDDNGRPFTLS